MGYQYGSEAVPSNFKIYYILDERCQRFKDSAASRLILSEIKQTTESPIFVKDNLQPALASGEDSKY